ncbi:MAG TPA: UDP-N-acetylmuramate dehydrogenase [Thermoanaerobaculia bacterium]|nr:UDP-N-acetylmuramate dehydrogenase [Thermoanaerobaculia bacterium]
MSDQTENILVSPSGFELEANVPLAPLTTIGIGGPARYYLRATTNEAIAAAVEWCRANQVPLFVLGGGSNLLIADDGFSGLVLHVATSGIVVESTDSSSVIVRVAAGEEWDGFVELAVRNGWAGIECLAGIPGSSGATPIQNVGAYGQEVSETIVRVEALERTTGAVRSFTNEDCRFRYRESLFKSEQRDTWVILSVTYRLVPGGPPTVRYPELARELEERGANDLITVRDTVLEIRRRKGMVLDPRDPDTRSDGSFFMNPILKDSDVKPFLERASAGIGLDVAIPRFPAGEGRTKLSAAWLIENAGFRKGYAMGRAGLSSKHTLAVVNRGGASAAEILALVRTIQDRVEEVFGVRLHPEPNFIGFGDGG